MQIEKFHRNACQTIFQPIKKDTSESNYEKNQIPIHL